VQRQVEEVLAVKSLSRAALGLAPMPAVVFTPTPTAPAATLFPPWLLKPVSKKFFGRPSRMERSADGQVNPNRQPGQTDSP
jgi:hypothetical protein